ncbi:helix-turn-helix domain-containing protein [Flaviramulus sp. BrNp1-15]|uniref:helix-turn-helix domain-containing protein n=1 Tax=Flaviramulus sp. BrNp1-15 TaxID=2916754 RepID=UPI001EE80D40|nr:helix-turn-helix domain-containing protein [Flaviramulus sp. BrNp1-15]ULC59646.1 helix-turn-helix domain-containing protein [Flaviramulus sp. BrNp1-15]
MFQEFKEFATNAILKVGDENLLEDFNNEKPIELFTFIRTLEYDSEVVVDGVPFTLKSHSILALTPVQNFKFLKGENIIVYQFNREFYCIKDHDEEVGCAGLLFFGNDSIPVLNLDKDEQEKFSFLHEVFLDELQTKDNIQAEMLRMLMARFMIKATRILKNNSETLRNQDSKIELLRHFNVLVESHFKQEHSVSFYADKLFKSPKTLSNTFSKFNKSPLRIIHERIILEAKRQLMYTKKSTKEIAYDIGFDDASHLSRLFKKNVGISPSEFQNSFKTTS